LITIPGKEGKDPIYKKVLCIEEVADKEVLDRIAIDFMGDQKIDMLNGLGEGDHVHVNFNVVYNAYEDKIFNSVRGWKIQRVPSEQPKMPNGDDLPF
jgi:hypothetical protein